MTTLKRSQLVEAAKELNEQLDLEPAIDTKPGKKNKDLQDMIAEASQLVDPNQDELSDETWNVLNNLGVDVGAEAREEAEPEEAEPEEELEVTEETEQEKSEVIENKTVKEEGAVAKQEKQGKEKKKESGELSNKAKVYQAWQKNETDVTKLSKIVSGAVKETTIKSWMNQWKNGKNLPAIAKK